MDFLQNFKSTTEETSLDQRFIFNDTALENISYRWLFDTGYILYLTLKGSVKVRCINTYSENILCLFILRD